MERIFEFFQDHIAKEEKSLQEGAAMHYRSAASEMADGGDLKVVEEHERDAGKYLEALKKIPQLQKSVEDKMAEIVEAFNKANVSLPKRGSIEKFLLDNLQEESGIEFAEADEEEGSGPVAGTVIDAGRSEVGEGDGQTKRSETDRNTFPVFKEEALEKHESIEEIRKNLGDVTAFGLLNEQLQANVGFLGWPSSEVKNISKAFDNAGIKTLEDVLVKTEADLMKTKGFGKRSFQLLLELLFQKGIIPGRKEIEKKERQAKLQSIARNLGYLESFEHLGSEKLNAPVEVLFEGLDLRKDQLANKTLRILKSAGIVLVAGILEIKYDHLGMLRDDMGKKKKDLLINLLLLRGYVPQTSK